MRYTQWRIDYFFAGETKMFPNNNLLTRQIQALQTQIAQVSCHNTTEILRTTAIIEKLLTQYPENLPLLILQCRIEILNSREQKARALAHRIWEIGGNLTARFEKIYIDNLLNLGLLEMAMILLKPRFADLAANLPTFASPMIKFALITGSVALLQKICQYGGNTSTYAALQQFVDTYKFNHYEEHFKNIGKIVMENFGDDICAYDFNLYTDRGFTDVEIVLYFSNYDTNLPKYKTMLENRIDGYFLTAKAKRIYNLSFVFRSIKDHPNFA